MKIQSFAIVPLLCALGSVPLAMAQSSGSAADSTSSGSSGTASAASGQGVSTGKAAKAGARNDDKAVQDLLAAAQRLRDAVQAMAQAPAGHTRTEAIKQGNKALFDVQSAIAELPPNLLLADASESDYQKAMDKLKAAADRLRNAAQDLAKEPAGLRRNESIKQINQALVETNQAMIDALPATAQNEKGQGQKGQDRQNISRK